MNNDYLIPIISLLLGWFLSESSNLFRTRRDEKKNYGVTLVFLLEFRHKIISLNSAISLLKEKSIIDEKLEYAIRDIYASIIPVDNQPLEKYHESINTISKINPLLAYELINRDSFLPALENLKNAFKNKIDSNQILFQQEKILTNAYLKVIEELILKLSFLHSIKTWVKIKKYLSKPDSWPKEITELLDLIKKT